MCACAAVSLSTLSPEFATLAVEKVKRKFGNENSSAEHIVCVHFWSLSVRWAALAEPTDTPEDDDDVRGRDLNICAQLHMALKRRCSVCQLPRDDTNKQSKWNNWFLFERKLIKRMKWGMFLKRRLIAVGPRFAFEIALIFFFHFAFLHFIYISRRRTGSPFDWVFADLQNTRNKCSLHRFFRDYFFFIFSRGVGCVKYEFVVFALNLNRISSLRIRRSMSHRPSVRLSKKHQ